MDFTELLDQFKKLYNCNQGEACKILGIPESSLKEYKTCAVHAPQKVLNSLDSHNRHGISTRKQIKRDRLK